MPRRSRWTDDEDFLLFLATEVYDNDWSRIADSLAIINKNKKQCRERWQNCLQTSARTTKWTDDDILTLLLYHALYGSKWSQISQHMIGFPPNVLKNKYLKLERSLNKECKDPIETLLRYQYMIRHS